MAILHHLDQEGGFTAANTDTGLTAYAYPTSPAAQLAKRDPAKAAAWMLESELPRPSLAAYVAQWDVERADAFLADLVTQDADRLAKLRAVSPA